MAHLSEIVKFIDIYLGIENIEDNCWNGLQFEGKENINKIVGAVDASADLFNQAFKQNADLIIVHHGHFWKSSNPSFKGWALKRLEILFKHNISLYAAHLPLDCHEEVGNNAQLISLLGGQLLAPFYKLNGINIGFIGSFKEPKAISQIESILNTTLPTKCKTLKFGKENITTFAVCSGGPGYKGFNEALKANVDLYITGDAIDIYSTAKDINFNVIFAGHNATEKVGIKALLDKLKDRYHLDADFIDLQTNL